MLIGSRTKSRSLYRSVRYKIVRETPTIQASQNARSFKLRRKSVLDVTKTTMAHTFYVNKSPRHSTTYLSKTQQQQNNQPDYLKVIELTIDKLQNKPQNKEQTSSALNEKLNITFPNIQQHQKLVSQSMYSFLTPLSAPFFHIKLKVENSRKELTSQKEECQNISKQLNGLKQQHLQRLTELQSSVKQCFENVRQLLRKNEVSQQQKKLRSKRELAILSEQHSLHRKLFQKIDGKSSALQTYIFNSVPLNLKACNDVERELYI